MTEINNSVLETHDQIKNPEELTSAEKKLFLKLDPTLFNRATFFELKNQITKKDHIGSKIQKIMNLKEKIINLPNTDEGVRFLVDNVFDWKYESEDIWRILIILKWEWYYNDRIDCTAWKWMLNAIKSFFWEEKAWWNKTESVSKWKNEKLKERNMNAEAIKQLAIESWLSENEVIEISFEFNELHELVERWNEGEAKWKLAIIAAKYGDKMWSFLDIASHPWMWCAPVLAFMKSPKARNILKWVSIVWGLWMRKKFLDAYDQWQWVWETVRNMWKYFIPFVWNYWDFDDWVEDINKWNVWMWCLNFASWIIWTWLDVLSIFPPVAVIWQPAKVWTKIWIKGAIKMMANWDSLLKVWKHVTWIFMETALSMKNGFLKFTDEIAVMKNNPAYRKKVLSKIWDQILTKIDDALPMIAKFEEYAKSLPWLIWRPMEIFIKSIKPVIYWWVDAMRWMIDTMTFKNITNAWKAANNAKDASKATEDSSWSTKEAPEQLKIQKNNQAIWIITKFIENNPNAKLPNELSVYYNKNEITRQDAQNLQKYLRENWYYEKWANSNADWDIGKATIKALENWRDDYQPNLEKSGDSESKDAALVSMSVPKSLSEAISIIKKLARTTSERVTWKVENIIWWKLDDISTAIKDNILNRSSGSWFSNLKDNLESFANNVKNNAKWIFDNYELITLSWNKVWATAWMFDIPIFRRKKSTEKIKIEDRKIDLTEKWAETSFNASAANNINIDIWWKTLQIVDWTKYGFNTPYVLVDANYPYVEFKWLRIWATISVWRNDPWRFLLPNAVSRDHLRVKLDQNWKITITNYWTNGTKISYAETIKQESKESSHQTQEWKLEKWMYQEVANFSSLKLWQLSTVNLNVKSENWFLSIANWDKVFMMRNGEEILLWRHFKDNFFWFDNFVSKEHCYIKFQDGKIYVKDISLNWTSWFKLWSESNDKDQWKERNKWFDSSKIENHEHDFTRNKERKESLEIPRESEVLAIWDLHWDFWAYKQNLIQSWAINQRWEWIWWNKKIVFHWDILADRTPEWFKILEDINRLRKEAKKEWWDILVIAWNHDDFLISFLMWRNWVNWNWIDISWYWNPWRRQWEWLWELEQFWAVSLGNRMKILENMRNDPQGRVVLEEICNMKLVEQIDDTLYLHTDPTDWILRTIINQSVDANWKSNIWSWVDMINRTWQNWLRQELLGETHWVDLNDFNRLADLFLDTWTRSPTLKQDYYRELKNSWINHIMHGHSWWSWHKRNIEWVYTIDNDFSFWKRWYYWWEKSFSKIKKNWQVEVWERWNELHESIDRTKKSEQYEFISGKIWEMKVWNIVTMKFTNWITFSFKKTSESWDIKLIHSSKYDLNAIRKTGKIVDTKYWPAFMYEMNWKMQWIKMNNAFVQSLDGKIMHNLDYWAVNSLVIDLRNKALKWENWEMWINIIESRQFIEKYESWKISESKKEQYDYHKNKIDEYNQIQSNLIYYTEWLSKFNL
jgi:hypothetical protein